MRKDKKHKQYYSSESDGSKIFTEKANRSNNFRSQPFINHGYMSIE